MSKIRLSVVIPGYNTRKEWWRRCADSVRRACGPEDEIICVDDGSKVPVEAEWVGADEDVRVRLLRKVNGGPASARNVALEAVRGKYVTFVDSDDEVMPEAFDRCIAKLESTDSDICVYGVKTIWVEEGLCKSDTMGEKIYGELQPRDVWELSQNTLLNYNCNKVYRVGFITGGENAWNKKILFDNDGIPCEDIMFNLNCIMAKAKWCSVEYVGYYYYRCGLTLLSSYKPSNEKGIRHGSQTWREYKDTSPGAKEIFGKFGEVEESDFTKDEWRNIWRPGTPIGFCERYRWLKKHSREILGNRSLWFHMLKTAAFTFARRYLYVRPVRRWNVKRMYPQVVEWSS